MNFINILVAICSLMFFMIGADKFLGFLEPPCSLQSHISPIIWQVLGVLQLLAGILIWLPNTRKYVVSFFAVFMIVFSIVHFTQGTSDVGGAAFMAFLLGLIIWNPRFLNGRKTT